MASFDTLVRAFVTGTLLCCFLALSGNLVRIETFIVARLN